MPEEIRSPDNFEGDLEYMNRMCRSSVRMLLCVAATTIPFFTLAGTPELIADKTLVAWVRLDNLSQSGSGVISIQDGDEFDAIAFGEHVEGRWIAGSNTFQRTQSQVAQESLKPETARPNQWLQLAIVYRAKQIEIWRDGELYVSYQARYQHAYFPRCDIYLGLRCLYGEERFGHLRGAIDEARIYDFALDGGTIRVFKPGKATSPKPYGCWTFDNGVAEDLMGNYPSTKLIGREQRFRVLFNRDMMEVYVDDYLTLQVRVNNTGRLGMLTGGDPGAISNFQIWRSDNGTERPPAAF